MLAEQVSELHTLLESQQTVSYRWYAQHFELPVHEAKDHLAQFAATQSEARASHLLSGVDGSGRSVVKLVSSKEELESIKKEMMEVFTEHIYSLHIPERADGEDVWASNLEQDVDLYKQLGRDPAPNCLLDNRWSSVKCGSLTIRDPRSRIHSQAKAPQAAKKEVKPAEAFGGGAKQGATSKQGVKPPSGGGGATTGANAAPAAAKPPPQAAAAGATKPKSGGLKGMFAQSASKASSAKASAKDGGESKQESKKESKKEGADRAPLAEANKARKLESAAAGGSATKKPKIVAADDDEEEMAVDAPDEAPNEMPAEVDLADVQADEPAHQTDESAQPEPTADPRAEATSDGAGASVAGERCAAEAAEAEAPLPRTHMVKESVKEEYTYMDDRGYMVTETRMVEKEVERPYVAARPRAPSLVPMRAAPKPTQPKKKAAALEEVDMDQVNAEKGEAKGGAKAKKAVKEKGAGMRSIGSFFSKK